MKKQTLITEMISEKAGMLAKRKRKINMKNMWVLRKVLLIENWQYWFEGEAEEKWRIEAIYLSSEHNLRLKKENTVGSK